MTDHPFSSAPSASASTPVSSSANNSRGIHLVVMGVAGCGKSAVGRLMADQLALPLIEGDDFHSPGNIQKMKQGIALTDDDRSDWLASLADQLRASRVGSVLTCSALKAAYRDRLRQAAPDLRFVYLQLTPAQALLRVSQRQGHFYPPSLVDSQFEALQDPTHEEGVLAVDASHALDQVVEKAIAWIGRG